MLGAASCEREPWPEACGTWALWAGEGFCSAFCEPGHHSRYSPHSSGRARAKQRPNCPPPNIGPHVQSAERGASCCCVLLLPLSCSCPRCLVQCCEVTTKQRYGVPHAAAVSIKLTGKAATGLQCSSARASEAPCSLVLCLFDRPAPRSDSACCSETVPSCFLCASWSSTGAGAGPLHCLLDPLPALGPRGETGLCSESEVDQLGMLIQWAPDVAALQLTTLK
ncbi:hypothetical protein BU16DRAFT_108156 [Lophium mytilinum]|uniref:Uncharacterized protein n=1 Tax=Lophium mytilinum TaxID=390894 RepID=A0A6A6QII4_9PEZI|nr:hypothetical protein BU16DRAFT_108156 [Lophium mytilinum]